MSSLSCGSGFSVWNLFTMCRRRRNSDTGSEASLVRNGTLQSSACTSKTTLASQESIVPNSRDYCDKNTFISGNNSCLQDSYDKPLLNNVHHRHYGVDSNVNTDSVNECYVRVTPTAPIGLPCCLRVNQSTDGRPQYQIYKSTSAEQTVRDFNSREETVESSDRPTIVNDDKVFISNTGVTNTSLLNGLYPASNGHTNTLLLENSEPHANGIKQYVVCNNDKQSSPNVPSASCMVQKESVDTLPDASGATLIQQILCNSADHQDKEHRTSNEASVNGWNWPTEPNGFSSLTNGHVTQTHQNKDGRYFLRLIEMEEMKLGLQCSNAEIHLLQHLNEDVEGLIRAAIGKARLLTTKKFRQFRELCENNLSQAIDAPFQTTDDDLAGFWDMVIIQINDVNRLFREIETLQQNGWKPVAQDVVDYRDHSSCNETATDNQLSGMLSNNSRTSTNIPSSSTKPASYDIKCASSITKPAVNKPSSSSRTASSDKKSQATLATKRREEARQRLMAAKIAGRQRKTSESDNDVEIFLS